MRFILFILVIFLFISCGEEKVDFCKDVSCKAHSTCDPDSGVCDCDDNYKLKNGICEKIGDPCIDKVCQKNSTCNSDNGNCDCNNGYTLTDGFCKANSSKCEGKICKDHATCNPDNGNCECDNGYTIKNGVCKPESTDPCEGKSCQSHATCNSDNGNCECDNGYELNGEVCEKKSNDPCEGKSCQSHATCNSDNGNCECDTGYELNGEVCEKKSNDPCEGKSCQSHAKCNPENGNCECETGYKLNGEVCEEDTDLCANANCIIHSTCNPENGVCECDNNYTRDGENCILENGTHDAPFLIKSFSYSHEGDTSNSRERFYENYNCSDADESGSEVYYKFKLNQTGKISINVITEPGVDVDIYLLSELNRDNCLERNDKKIDSYLLPGTYYIVIDTYVNSSGTEKKGAYQLNIDYIQNTNDDFWATRAPIPDYIFTQMDGVSYKPGLGCTERKDLRYLYVMYKKLDGESSLGELVVHKKIANEIIDSFKIMYENDFRIERMVLISDSEYGGDDTKSMEDNNTSAYNCRKKTNGTTLSNHSFGKAIDINPKFNPYISSNGTVEPYNATRWKDRTLNDPGMIKKNDAVYNSFTSKGWIWGGDWTTIKDYQHFEKNQ